MNQTLTHRAGKHLVVTRIEQFTVPAYLHGDDIMDAITSGDGFVSIDFHGFKCSMLPLPGRPTRDIIYGKALDYFRELGVSLEGGTYVNIGWVDASKHKPWHGELVLTMGKGFTSTATWTGWSWIIDNGIKEEVTHWQRLPASPEHEVQA